MINLEIVEHQYEKSIIIGYVVCITLIAITILYFLGISGFRLTEFKNSEQFNPFIFIVVTLSIVLFIFHTLNTKKVVDAGGISLSAYEIIINIGNNAYPLEISELDKIKVVISGYSGQQLTGLEPPKPDIVGNPISDGYFQLQGYENKIRFTTNDGRRVSYNFYLGSKKDYEELKRELTMLKEEFPILQVKSIR